MAVTLENAADSKKPDYVCPKGHHVAFERWNYAKDDSENLIDANGIPMYENGLFCNSCNRPYGLSKLTELTK